MTILELVKRDHDELAELLDQLAVVARDGRAGRDLARTASRLVALAKIHARAEERVVYEVMRTRDPQLKAFALAGPHEHETLEITLDKLLVQSPGEEYGVIVRVARDLFEMHARDEEEAEILPLLAEAFSAEDLVTLADDLLAEQARIRPQVYRLVGIPARAA